MCSGCVGAEDDDGDRARARIVPQQAEDLLAGDVRQVAIEQDQVGAMVAREVEADPALHRG